MKPMSNQRAAEFCLALALAVMFPLSVLAEALDWSSLVQATIAVAFVLAAVAAKLLLTDRTNWRWRRARRRRARRLKA